MENNLNNNVFTKIFLTIFIIVLFMLLTFFAYVFYVIKSDKIAKGIYIDEYNVSNLSKDAAKRTLSTAISSHSQDEIRLVHTDNALEDAYETSISVEQIEPFYDIDKAIDEAYSYNKSDNVFNNFLTTIKLMFVNTTFPLDFSCNEDVLCEMLEKISKELPDGIQESSYYQEGSNVILTKGKSGCIVDINQTKEVIKDKIANLNYKGLDIELLTLTKYPEKLNVEEIFSEFEEDAQNASFSTDPYEFNPSKCGVKFNVSLDEAKEMLNNSEDSIKLSLQIVNPEITNEMLGNDPFPSVLAQYSSKYSNNANRTTNLRLAAGKINGTILLPGETFSYNKTVGERTAEAGYKNASIYENGQVVDGLGGGICQVASTLYNVCVLSNLEIVERSNHMFAPGYVADGMDATVAYGQIDYKFKNNRDYPIKIECSVENGYCYFKILGLSYEDDPVVKVETTKSSTTSYLYTTTYKLLYDSSGNLIEKTLLSKDTYKKH